MTNAIVAILTVIIVLFIGALVGTAAGAVAGWVVGLFFTNTIQTVLAAFGIQAVQVWQLGAFFGFIGGFFRTVNTGNTK